MFKTFNKFFFFVFLFFCLLIFSAEGEKNCEKVSFSRLQFKHREHKGVGFNQGYSSLTALLTSSRDSVFLPYIDARLHVFNSGYLASNLGFGVRFSNPSNSFIFGVNTYYDFRNYKSFSSHQTSGGLELLTKWIDFRVDGYYPFSGKTLEQTPLFSNFQDKKASFKQHVYFALPSANGELGFFLPNPFKQINLYLAFGGYYLFRQSAFRGEVGDVPGGKVRLVATPKHYLSLGMDYTIDSLFGSRVNGYISLQVPLGPQKGKHSYKKQYYAQKEECLQYLSSMKRKTQDPVHNEIIPFYTKNITYTQKHNFIFVNNQTLAPSKIGSGNGTFNDPYTTLELAENNSGPNDIIYVFYGTGTSAGYDQGFTFQNNQIVTSSGSLLALPGFDIPAFTPGKLPVVTNEKNSSEPTISASNIENFILNGFNLNSVSGPTVSINSAGGLVQNNNITGSISGISCSGFSEKTALLISQNTITAMQAITINCPSSCTGTINIKNNNLFPLTSSAHDSAGIYATSLGNLTFKALSNTIFYNDSSALGYGVYFSGESPTNLAKNSLDISKNIISTSGFNDGISIFNSNNSVIQGKIDGNAILPVSTEQPNKGILISTSSAEPTCINLINNDNVLGYSFLNIGAQTFQMSSVNSTLAGVIEQNGNAAAGNFTTTGDISYVPPGSDCPPFEAIFVDNMADPTNANGSFSHPWTTLIDAQNHSNPGDLIYVFTGDGTTKGYNGGITLQEGQTIAGSSVSFPYKGFVIPGFGGTLPQITNNDGPAVITAPASTRIVGLGITGSSSNNGINFTDSSIVNKTASVEQSTLLVPLSGNLGINISDQISNLTLSILNNTFPASTAGEISLALGGNNSVIIEGNNLNTSNGPTSIVSTFSSGDNSIFITNNNIYSQSSSISISTAEAVGTLTEVLENNTIQSIGANAISGNLEGAVTALTMNNNTVIGSNNCFKQGFKNLLFGRITNNKMFEQELLSPGSFSFDINEACFQDFSNNTALSYDFSVYSPPVYLNFVQSENFVSTQNSGQFTFHSEGGIVPTYGQPCPPAP